MLLNPAVKPLTRYGAVFFIMMSNLLLELLLTRLFSATMWYHFAFVAVSVALFGTTVGAVIVHLWPGYFVSEHAGQLAARFALLYAASIVICIVLQLRLNVTFGASWSELAIWVALYVLVAIPFTLSGVFICMMLLGTHEQLGAVYCADLIGAGFGCALFVPFMAFAGGPRAVLPLAALAALGSALLAYAVADRRTLLLSVLTVCVSLGAFFAHLDRKALRVHWAKGIWSRDHVFEKWSAFARLVVDPTEDYPFGWGLSGRFPGTSQPPRQMLLTIDGVAATVLTGFNGDFGNLGYLQWDVTALAHAIRPRGAVLIVGVGGGRDILTALEYGHRRVIGVEVNRDILGLLRGPFADFTGHLAERPEVELVHDEARSYAARSPDHFAIIQASLVDTWAAAANGAYVLSENALYTQEAFQVFFDRLEPGGVLSVSRWYLDRQPGETLRLVSLASAALRSRGGVWPQRQLFLARTQTSPVSVATLLVAAQPFPPADIDTLRRWCGSRGFEELLSPSTAPDNTLAQLAGPANPVALLEAFPIDITAPSDDRPFFFNMLRVRDAARLDASKSDMVSANATAVMTLTWLLILVTALSGLCIIVPLWLRGSGSAVPHAVSRLSYFGSLGFGFILLELSQMQRQMIALGHPVYGLTVVLFSFLVAAGLGSLWARPVVPCGPTGRSLQRTLRVLIFVAVITGLGSALTSHAMEGAQTWMRIAASVVVLAPLGFILGIPLATGLALSASDPPAYRALYWGVNGATSVCGSVLATMLSLTWGITASYGVGVLAYAGALLAARRAFSSDRCAEVTGKF